MSDLSGFAHKHEVYMVDQLLNSEAIISSSFGHMTSQR